MIADYPLLPEGVETVQKADLKIPRGESLSNERSIIVPGEQKVTDIEKLSQY